MSKLGDSFWPDPAVDRLGDELVHHGGDGGVQHEGDQEQEAEDADDGQGPEEEGGVVPGDVMCGQCPSSNCVSNYLLDLLQPGRRLLRLPHGGVHLGHAGGCCWGWVSLSQSL